ncbi:Tn3 family transposase [Bacillus sp. REN16]|uniref:Tn3 family transposase n=1 Tax=Bacillus sp. REN16 TaxID=2887296 RepID=UPI003B63A042
MVDFITNYNCLPNLGDGTTSSSDGMRMQLGASSLHADANPHYGTGKGGHHLSIYE